MVRGKTYIVVMGVIILIVFSYVSFINVLPNNSSNSYFSTEEKSTASIEKAEYLNGVLVVNTSLNAKMGCIKSTKSVPKLNSKCWINVVDRKFSSSIYRYKKYYIWVIDDNGVISGTYEYKE